ncbi:MAG: sugar transferase [Lachnospiraceae bacterium]|nr:sugar transferase [Lachnospiraceae bacterium]
MDIQVSQKNLYTTDKDGIYERNFVKTDLEKIQDEADYEYITSHRKVYLFVKRMMDVVCSLIALVILSPVFLITTLAILFDSGRPIFFIQKRTGYLQKEFNMIKFRSMCREAPDLHKFLLHQNEADGPVFKIKKDPRITKVGYFIRRTSIDELPQLINILKGEMTIVGPRPIATYESKNMNSYQRFRTLAKPGLTCYWQCNGRNDVSFDHWMEMDLRYIREASLWVDIKIILKTIRTVLLGSGAY